MELPDPGEAGAPPIRVRVRAVRETAVARGRVAWRAGLCRGWSLHTLVTRGLTLTTPGSPVMIMVTPRLPGRHVTGENEALFLVQP